MDTRDAHAFDATARETPAVVVALGLAVSLLLLGALQFWYRSFTVDDAFITFRYSENLARGLGVVYNAGERVEGYTNFLWMILLALVRAAGGETLAGAKVLGVVCGLALVPLTAVVSIMVSGRRSAAAVIAPLFLASTPALAVWSVAGLETTLFATLVTAAVVSFMREGESPSRFPLSALLLVLAAMTRPDGVVVFAVTALFALMRARGDRRFARQTLLFFAVFVVVAAAYMAWRWSYFGYPLPNTFYAKTGRGAVQVLGGILYTTAGIRKHGGMLLFVLALVPAFWGTPRRERARYAVTMLAVWMAYNVYKGHDVLTVFRFFVPILPVFYALAAVAAVSVYTQLRATGLGRAAGALLASLFVVGTLGINGVLAYTSKDPRRQVREYQLQLRLDARLFMPVVERLQSLAPDGASLALIDAGAIPYYTGWYTIDRWGLCDEHIAHVAPKGPLGEKYDPDYVLSKRPTFIQTKVLAETDTSGELRGEWAGDAALLSHPDFRAQYVALDDPVLRGFYVRRDAGIVGTSP